MKKKTNDSDWMHLNLFIIQNVDACTTIGSIEEEEEKEKNMKLT